MPALFRPSPVSCFFCQQSISPLPRDPQSFRCPNCTCLNRYDSNGGILSDEPAMHDEALNSRSFAKRASPSKDRLPTMYGANKSVFCHTCQTNQMLLTHLLSNYLPSFEHPDYSRRLESLPDYRTSLHARYPPVCDKCLPAVEDEIRSKDHMARTKALGGWLKQSKGKEKERKVSGSGKHREKLGVQLAAWKIRGCLWATTLLLVVVGNSIAAFGYYLPHQTTHLRPFLPIVAILSILWTVWDPTYATLRRSQIQGRDIRVQGRRLYIVLQLLSWTSRVLTSAFLALSCFRHQDYLHLAHDPPSSKSRMYFSVSLALELSIFFCSCAVLRLQQPPSIRLLDTTVHKLTSHPTFTPSPTSSRSSPAPRHATEPDLLATLSLSSTPAATVALNPIFGLPSLLSPTFSRPSSSALGLANDRMDEDNTAERDADMMDWSPTDTSSATVSRNMSIKDDDALLLRRQRFFPPEQPTGLEGLLARTLLVDDDNSSAAQQNRNSRGRLRLKWLWVSALLVVPLLGVAYRFWWRWDVTILPSHNGVFTLRSVDQEAVI